MYEAKGKTSNNFKFTIIASYDGNCKWKLKDKSTGNGAIGRAITLPAALADILKICGDNGSNIDFKIKVKIPMGSRITKRQSLFQWRLMPAYQCKSISEYHTQPLSSGPSKVIKFSRINNPDGNLYLLNTYLDGVIVENEALMSNNLTEACEMLTKLIARATHNEESKEEKKYV